MDLFGRAAKRKEQILAGWGRRKTYRENQYYAEQYYAQAPPAEGIDEQTASDLDFSRLFAFLDRTTSVIGRQILYRRLRRGRVPEAERRQLENAVSHYADRDIYPILESLDRLQPELDFIYPTLLYGPTPELPDNRWLIRWFQWLSFACLLFGFKFPVLWLAMVPLMAINLFIHYRIKQQMGLFIDVFYRLKTLLNVGGSLVPLSHHSPAEKLLLRAQLARLRKYVKRLQFLQLDTRLAKREGPNVFAYFLELFKFVTLLDVVIFYGLVANLPDLREAVQGVYLAVGEVDLALSVLALRGSLPYFSRPRYDLPDPMNAREIYHPLLEQPVPNDLRLTTNGVLITGSNMAGKSTFIKAVNVSALCAQTLNTAFARSYASRPWKIVTSINTRDDIALGSSYYQREVERIGELLRSAEIDGTPCLLTIDEVFRGTNTLERVSSAAAVLAYLARDNNMVLVSTHDLELADLLGESFDLYHFQESVSDNRLAFDYRLHPGKMTQRNAIKILALAGYPEAVIQTAKRLASRRG